MSDKPLRIVSLESENYKRLKAVHISPKGDVVQITGRNDNGKTSVLDSIFAALKQVAVDAPMPIRAGQEKARIRLELGTAGAVELVVERKYSKKGDSLTVETADGAVLKKPQAILDAMLGALSFDPLEFVRMKPAEQYDVLKKTVKLEVDIDALEGKNRGDFDRRTEVTRELKAKRAAADAIVLRESPGEPVDERQILDRIEGAAKRNADIERVKAGRRGLEEKAKRYRDHAATLKQTAERLRQEAATADAQAIQAEENAAALEKEVQTGPALPEPVDVSGARAELEQAQARNKAVAEHAAAVERQKAAYKEVEALAMREAELTQAIEARTAQKAAAIQAAKMPVEGLGFGEGVVTYKDVPFVQASSAVKTRVSLMIAMAANPRLRVIRIQDGSLLDDQSMAILAEMARERDYQVWVERVDTSGKVGIYIEDGEVRAVDGDLFRQPEKA